jgi:hypothetical protein
MSRTPEVEALHALNLMQSIANCETGENPRVVLREYIRTSEQRAEAAEARAERLTQSLLAHDAERTLYLRRLLWLHDCSTGTTDAEGYEWGIYRVKWNGGQAVEVWQTNSDFSDLDAAMERDGYKLPASAKAMEARVKELEEREAKLRAALVRIVDSATACGCGRICHCNDNIEALLIWKSATTDAALAALAETKGTT